MMLAGLNFWTNRWLAGDLSRHGAHVTTLWYYMSWPLQKYKISNNMNLQELRVGYVMPFCGYFALQWRHNDRGGVSNHQPHGCLLNRLFMRRSKETSKLRVTGLCTRNSPGPVNSPHKRLVTRKMFPFDVVIMGLPLNPTVLRNVRYRYAWYY